MPNSFRQITNLKKMITKSNTFSHVNFIKLISDSVNKPSKKGIQHETASAYPYNHSILTTILPPLSFFYISQMKIRYTRLPFISIKYITTKSQILFILLEFYSYINCPSLSFIFQMIPKLLLTIDNNSKWHMFSGILISTKISMNKIYYCTICYVL